MASQFMVFYIYNIHIYLYFFFHETLPIWLPSLVLATFRICRQTLRKVPTDSVEFFKINMISSSNEPPPFDFFILFSKQYTVIQEFLLYSNVRYTIYLF